jgi:hypothetical protein
MTEDERVAYVTAARDAGFSDQQWKAMFYESGPYDLSFPTLTLQAFVQIVNERLSLRATHQQSAALDHIYVTAHDGEKLCVKCGATETEALAGEPCGLDRPGLTDKPSA